MGKSSVLVLLRSERISQFLTMGLFVCLFYIPASESGRIRSAYGLTDTNYSLPGDFVIGIIYSIHTFDEEKLCCGDILPRRQLRDLEAMAFAVEEINNRTDLLPNVTLGFAAFDDCYSDMHAFAQALRFVQRESPPSCRESDSIKPVKAVAVIGGYTSSSTVKIASLLSLFHVPILSFRASSTELDDDKYSYFSRIIPSDVMQTRMTVDILAYFKWQYVSIVYSDDVYGTEAFLAITKHLQSYTGYCLAVTVGVSNTFEPKQYDEAVRKLLKQPFASVVLLFCTTLHTLHLFEAVDRVGNGRHFTWVSGDEAFSNPSMFLEVGHIANGALAISFADTLVDRFEQRFHHLTLKNGSRNPWFGRFFSAAFNCSLDGRGSGLEPCDENKEFGTSKGYFADPASSISLNAVYAIAHALDALLKNCTQDDVKECVKPRELLDSLRAVHFQGDGAFISFDKDGNGQTNYALSKILFENGKVVRRRVGMWNMSSLSLSIKDAFRGSTEEESIPRSVCSEPCSPGEYAVVTHSACCFDCVKCRENERVESATKKCEACPTSANFTWPDDETRTTCYPLAATMLDVSDSNGSVLFVLLISVCAVTTTTAILYVKNGDNSLIKMDKPMSVIMYTSHMISCGLVLIFFMEPSNVICIVKVAVFHLSLTLSYAPLLVKTSESFSFWKSWLTNNLPTVPLRSHLAVVFGSFGIQVIVTGISMALHPPFAATDMPDPLVRKVQRSCTIPVTSFLPSVIFNLLLVIICAAHVIKVKDLPAYYHKTKFIPFAIYTILIMWLAFFPTYIMLSVQLERELCLAFFLLLNVMSCQVFLFIPNLYAIYFLSQEELVPFLQFTKTRRGVSVYPVQKTSTNEKRVTNKLTTETTLKASSHIGENPRGQLAFTGE